MTVSNDLSEIKERLASIESSIHWFEKWCKNHVTSLHAKSATSLTLPFVLALLAIIFGWLGLLTNLLMRLVQK